MLLKHDNNSKHTYKDFYFVILYCYFTVLKAIEVDSYLVSRLVQKTSHLKQAENIRNIMNMVKDCCQKFNIYMLSMKNLYLSINTKPAGISLNLPDLRNLIPIISPRMPAAPVYIKFYKKGD